MRGTVARQRLVEGWEPTGEMQADDDNQDQICFDANKLTQLKCEHKQNKQILVC